MFVSKCPVQLFHFEFMNRFSSVSISRTLVVQNNVKCFNCAAASTASSTCWRKADLLGHKCVGEDQFL